MLRVGVDARTIARGNPRGIGRYVNNIVRHICRQSRDVEFVLFYDADQAAPAGLEGLRATCVPFRFRGDRWRLWERMGLPLQARRAGVDVLHCPANVSPAWQPVPTIITVHDTILWDDPNEVGLKKSYTDGPISQAVKRAAAIITISQASRRDIEARFPDVVSRLHVISHGLSPTFLAPVDAPTRARMRKALGLPTSYVLYVGGAAPRKRACWAVRLLKDWREQARRDLDLAVLGFSSTDAGSVVQLAKELELAKPTVILPAVPEDLMPALYAECEFLAYPSLREGFGFPPLEAQACGRPVLVSHTSSLPEVSGPAAKLLPPNDFRAWVDAGIDLLNRPPDARLAEGSRRWAADFNWRESAAQTLAVYRGAAEGVG